MFVPLKTPKSSPSNEKAHTWADSSRSGWVAAAPAWILGSRCAARRARPRARRSEDAEIAFNGLRIALAGVLPRAVVGGSAVPRGCRRGPPSSAGRRFDCCAAFRGRPGRGLLGCTSARALSEIRHCFPGSSTPAPVFRGRFAQVPAGRPAESESEVKVEVKRRTSARRERAVNTGEPSGMLPSRA